MTCSELTGELEHWRRFGRATAVSEYDGVPVFSNEFWTSRQRAAHSLHEISYRACFKPQLPRFFISRLTSPGDVVFDPFMGRGTTLLEAALLGRRPLGNDVNPLSRMLVEPRLAPPPAEEVDARLGTLALDEPIAAPAGFDAFFHARTLNQICRLRAYLLERDSAGVLDGVDRWIRMVAINRLTGHSSGFFSVYTLPPNQAASIDSQRRINARRGQTPEYRDAARLILRKTRSLLRDAERQCPVAVEPGFLQQAVDAPFAYDGPPVTALIGDVAAVHGRRELPPGQLDAVLVRRRRPGRHRHHPDPAAGGLDGRLVRAVLGNVAALTKRSGLFAFEVGEIRRGALLLDHIVTDVARETPWEPVCIVINAQAFTKTSNTWGVANNRGGTNTNRIVLLRA